MSGPVVSACLGQEELVAWGRRIGPAAVGSRVFVTLDGPLGAGKTTLVRACCEGARVEGPVTSPTFTLVQRYGSAEPVHHVDLYRIEHEEDLCELGWDDLTSGQGAVFVEWAERAGSRLPPDRWEIRLSIPEQSDRRGVEAVSCGRAPAIPGIE